MDALHLTHPGRGGMLEAAKHVWYPYLHRNIVPAAQNCKNCRDKGRILKVISGKKHYTTLDAVVEPNEEIQLDFAGPLPDENDKEVYILVGIDRFSRFPYAKDVANNRADTIIPFMQNQIVNHRHPRNIRCDQAQGFRAKKFLIYCKTNHIKLIFAPVDDHRAMGMVARLIRPLKSRLAIMKIDKNNTYKLASDVAELIKTLRITPNATTKNTPFEVQFGRRPNTPLTNISTSLNFLYLSCENTKLSCLDEKVLTKPALSVEAMWDRKKNSGDELDLVYKDTRARESMPPTQKDHQYLPEPTFTPVENDTATTTNNPQRPTCTSPYHNPGKRRAKVQPEPINQQDTITLESSDDDYDRQLLKKFPIGAHLPLSNKPYDALKLKRSFLSEKSNNLEILKTRKPIRPLTNQEKQNLKRAPLIFLKDRFKGPAHTIDPKT